MSDPTTTPTPTEARQDVRERHQIVSVGRSDLPGGVYVKCRCDEHVLIPAAAYTDHVLAALPAPAPSPAVSAPDLDAIRAGHDRRCGCAARVDGMRCETGDLLAALAAAHAENKLLNDDIWQAAQMQREVEDERDEARAALAACARGCVMCGSALAALAAAPSETEEGPDE